MILKGEKVILRPVKLNDAQRFVKWLSDPEVNKFTTRRKITLKEEKKWIRDFPARKEDKIFAIDTKDGIHIGSIGLHHIDSRDKNARFGILIGDKKYWNQGYGRNATKVILNYAFNKLKLHRIDLGVYSYNSRAIKVYKKLGFKLEGIKREAVFHKGKFYNDLCMGILRKEWSKSNKRG